ncbi:hypothetical protein [Halosegnis longus]|uniref:hypothetical protein n=1 Tax=Halosegnis longus TaxID=2216012 RepID=UPI00190E7968|nr:hypothetical protein [Salella cibi]
MAGPHESIRVFAASRPSLRELWASRSGRFDRLHLISPSDAVAGESVTVRVQAWDEYERLHAIEGTPSLDSTDDDATVPGDVSFDGDGPSVGPGNPEAGFTTVEVMFSTTGVQYLTAEYRGERFVSNPVRVHDTEPDERTLWGIFTSTRRCRTGRGRRPTASRSLGR